jgi:NTP pyrophosphatase (non-canonical NTP hydrolase)
MPDRTIRDWQRDVDEWVMSAGGGYWTPLVNLARIAEEVGETARLVNHLYGPKPKKVTEAPQELGMELADILFAVICMANSEGIDLQDSFARTMEKYRVRDKDRYRGREAQSANE